MHERTGAIAHFETDDDAIWAGYTKKLTPKEEAKLMPMNRHDRRAWAVQQRRKAKAPPGVWSKP